MDFILVVVISFVTIYGWILLHELGHYLTARCFGAQAKFKIGILQGSTVYTPLPNMPKYQKYLVSFMGVIGLVAFIPYFIILETDLSTMGFITAVIVGYSIYETLRRYRLDKKECGEA